MHVRSVLDEGHACGTHDAFDVPCGVGPHQALALFTKVLHTARSTYTTSEALALTGIGRMHRVLGDLDSAEAFSTEEALAVHREITAATV